MTQFKPGVSVLMTAYNAMPYLDDAVRSILDQTFDDFEFIIVNDGSTDETASYLDSIDDPRVRVFHEVNRGTAGASNFGLQQCTRKYIARMDADDRSLSTRLAKQYQYMETHPEVSLLSTQLRVISNRKRGMDISIPTENHQILAALKSLNHGICHGCCFYRSHLIHECGGYWKTHRSYDDWDMFLRMSERGELANLPEVLYEYRILPTSLVGSQFREMRRYYSYAIECWLRRQEGQPEPTIEDFLEGLGQRSIVAKCLDAGDIEALSQYRAALVDFDEDRRLRGYARLVWASLCSPQRLYRRVRRILAAKKA